MGLEHVGKLLTFTFMLKNKKRLETCIENQWLFRAKSLTEI